MTAVFPIQYPVLDPTNPELVLLGDDGTQTGKVSITGLVAAITAAVLAQIAEAG